MEERVLAELGQELRGRFAARLERLVLFGSRARGEGHEESDLDVLVLIRDLEPAERREVLDLAFRVEERSGLCVSPLARDPRAFDPDSALGREIARDGVPL